MSQGKGTLRAIAPAVILLALALVYISPVLSEIRNIGVSDWDSQLFYHAAPLRSILDYGQFPLWSPYFCGGSPFLASPEISFLAPPFIFVLIFGEVVGVKLIIAFYTIAGMWGMYYLARVMKFGRFSSFLPPVVYIMSSWWGLRISEGHTGFLPFALLPFVAAFYIRAMEERRWIRPIIPGAAFLAWMILAGGVYPFTVSSIFLFFFCVLSIIARRSLRPALLLAVMVGLTFLLSAVKSVPQYEFVSAYPRSTSAVEFHSGEILKDSLFSRNQRVTTQDASFYRGADESTEEYLRGFWGGQRPWGWQEYGAFVGMAAFALYLLGFVFVRRIWVWLSMSFIALLLSMGEFSPVNIWAFLRKLPVFSSLHGPSRIAPLFVFSLAVVAGYALTRLEEGGLKKLRLPRPAVIALVLIVLLEIMTVSMPVLKDAFIEPPYDITPGGEFAHIIVRDPTRTNYPNFLAHLGTANCYESMHPPTSVIPYGDEEGRLNPDYRGEAWLEGGRGTARLTYFSPNRFTVAVNASGPDRLVLNQNYFKGWKADVGGRRMKAEARGGLVSAPVGPGASEVSFHYSPVSFKIGLALTIISLLLSVVLYIRPPKSLES